MKILFIGGCANGRFIDVTPVEFENPNDPEDYHWAYPDLFNVPEPISRSVTRWAEGEAPASFSRGYQGYKLNEVNGERGECIRFYSLGEMSGFEVMAVLLNSFSAQRGRV